MGPKHIAAVRIYTTERLGQLSVIFYLERTYLNFCDTLIFHLFVIFHARKVTAYFKALFSIRRKSKPFLHFLCVRKPFTEENSSLFRKK